MFYNNKDYFFFSGVKNVFRKYLNDPEIDNKEIIFVLKMKNFPFRTITRKKGNNDIAVGIYDKDVIRSYFDGTEKTEEIRRIIDKYRNDDIADLYAQLTTRKNYQPENYSSKSYKELWDEARNKNKEKMIAYLDNLDKNKEEDMDYVSRELLANDDVIYESQGVINDKLYYFAEYIFNECEYYMDNEEYDEWGDISFTVQDDVWDEYRKLYNIPAEKFNVKVTDAISGSDSAAVSLKLDSDNLHVVDLKIRPYEIERKDGCIPLIMHELTHVVNFYANTKKGDEPLDRYSKYIVNVKSDSRKTQLEKDEVELIDHMYYYFDRTEMNARISQNYYYLLHDKSTQEYLSDVNNNNIHKKIDQLYHNIADSTYVYEMENIIEHIYDDNIIYDFDDDYEENSGLTARYEKYKKCETLLSKLRKSDKNYDSTLSSYIKRKLDLVSYLQDILEDFEKRIYRMLYKLIEDVKNKKYINESEDLSDVETEWKPKEGLFLSKSPRGIANYLLKHSKDKGQAMKRLTFYMNRAGENLKNKTVLNKVKDLLKSDDANESYNDWTELDGIGYVKDRSFNINMKIDEAYSDLKRIQKDEYIPSEEYLEKYPNLKLARMLGNKLLTGNNWKKYPYRRSYYFNIDMIIDDPVFKGRKIHGLLRISDHKVNPYRFAEEFGKNRIIDVDGKIRPNGEILKVELENGKTKNYSFGISITLPFTNDLTVSPMRVRCEPHVFEYISQNIQDKELGELKAKLENIVNRLETAYVGTSDDDDFSPYEYKEVTIGNAIFNISSEDQYLHDRNKLINAKPDEQVKSEKQTLRSRRIKQLDFPAKDLNYYMNELGMQPKILIVNADEHKRGHKTIKCGKNSYNATHKYDDVWKPYYVKKESEDKTIKVIIGFNDGLYVWKDINGNTIDAAIVENKKIHKIDF